MTNHLTEFVEHARKKGMDHQTIRMLLLSAGWKEKDIAQALTDQALDMPVPVPSDGGGAREAFFHLLTFASFYTTAISLLVLFFRYINRLFPDPALGNDYYYENSWDLSAIRWSIAALIVAFPLFVWLSRFLLKEMAENREKSWSPVRRWLTYLTLFVAASALMGDVITLVFALLEGELTIRFILKVLLVLIVAGGSFTYYFLSLKMPVKKENALFHRLFAAGAGVMVLIAIVWGIVIAGSPQSERLRKFDEVKISDFRAIQSEISNITLGDTQYGDFADRRIVTPIPATLEDVVGKAEYQKPNIVDPQTGELYEYEVASESVYTLCATFNTVRDEQYDIFWNHPAGGHCYTFDVLAGNK